MSIVQIIVIVSALFFFAQVMYFTSKNKLQDQQAFIWLMFASIGVLLALFLDKINQLAGSIGIAYMPSLIFVLAFLIILNLLIFHTISLTRQQNKVKNLTQELAYLNKEIREIKKNQLKG
ncbi:DUF2304 domain-containing protein [Halobacillus trueperi]|uniref:DUF2304 domain-containing protein n=1 Tax=Halobacillus trueperi TaxID=156205 RepID=A0A3E0J7B0_9BACI|nr:DUF2304 domain-containing protein [Halobacillus trueperi]REJ08803.1 DUF2304 domain-containing protein [Halobacillus trueperi]